MDWNRQPCNSQAAGKNLDKSLSPAVVDFSIDHPNDLATLHAMHLSGWRPWAGLEATSRDCGRCGENDDRRQTDQ